MNKDNYIFYRTKNGKIARYNPNKPWEAMHQKGKIVKKTIEVPKIVFSKEEPEYEEGYDRNNDEIKTAKFIQGTLGKKVKLLNAKIDEKFNPDALIDNKYSEFKNPSPTSKLGMDALTRKGLKQINYYGEEKAGFVFHWADSLQQNKRDINNQIISRMNRSKNKNGQVIVKKKGKLFIYRKK